MFIRSLLKPAFAFIVVISFTHLCSSQSLPIDFEGDITTEDFVDFDGGTGTVIANPESGGINMSEMVGQIVRDGGEIWAGSKIILDENLDFSTNSAITMKVFSTAPTGTIVKLKLEGTGTTERDMPTTTINNWEEITWDFTGEPTNFNELVFMFDYGNLGDGSETSTFLFDDVHQIYTGTQIDLPVDFESSDVNYTMSDFGQNQSMLVEDPYEPGNMCIQVIKPVQAATWAGTTIGTPAGFATDIPLTLIDSKMSARVWSPEAGTPIRLKVEDSDDPTHTCETETNTTLAGEWEIMEFDFANEAPGTAELSVGLGMGWTYNMASIFFNFDTDGATAGEQTYYFDDVQFGEFTVGVNEYASESFRAYPNPTLENWTFIWDDAAKRTIQLYNLQGQLVQTTRSSNNTTLIDGTELTPGTYLARVLSPNGLNTLKLVKR